MMAEPNRYPQGCRFSRRPQLHVVTGPPDSLTHVIAVCRAIAPFVDKIHVRLKGAPHGRVWQWAYRLLDTNAARLDQLVINGVPEIARHLQTGLHLPESGLIPTNHPWGVGVSVHSPAMAAVKEAEGADYLFFGHIYPSSSKPGVPPRGLGRLKATVDQVKIPVIAIGGIDHSRLAEVAATGCAGVAVISALMKAEHPEQAARSMRQVMEQHWT
jgi:thiamine-phosphate diphosphorylase